MFKRKTWAAAATVTSAMALCGNAQASLVDLGDGTVEDSTPLVWLWVKERSQTLKIAAVSLGLITTFGGIFIFSLELPALTQTVFPEGLTGLDAQVYTDYWNKLDSVYDPQARRGEVLFGRKILRFYVDNAPIINTPASVHDEGFNYMLLDETFWSQLAPQYKETYSQPCVKVLKEYHAKHGDEFRKVLVISTCQ